MALVDDIATYSNLWGPSGAEDLVIKQFVSDLEQLGINAHVDPLGNVIAKLNDPAPGHPKVMVSAHLDEIGFVVRKIEPDGFLRVHRVGGVNDRVIAGQQLIFQGNGFIDGVVGVKAKHVSSPEELRTVVSVDEAYVDVMVSSEEAAHQLGLSVGSLGTFASSFRQRGDYLQGKALDNRVAVAQLLKLARNLRDNPPQVGVTLVGTVQEEFSVRAGVTAARAVAPDLAFCLDIAIATDTPDLQAHGSVRLGAGPVITRFTRANLNGIIPNPKLWRFVRDTAKQHGIATQYGVLQGGLTDGSFMQYENQGIPTLDLSFATRYTHTPVETCHLADVQAGIQLLTQVLYALNDTLDLRRG